LEIAQLIARYPRVYHIAAAGAWANIKRRGLLSTSAILDDRNVRGVDRLPVESVHRPKTLLLGDEEDRYVLRDQSPMAPGRLAAALINGVTPRQWYEAVNSKVFFWAEERRMHGLLAAKANRDREHDVLVVNTSSLLRAHADEVWLSPINSGSAIRSPVPRDLSLFKRIHDYPARPSGAPLSAVVELIVDYSVLDIADHVTEVTRMSAARSSGGADS
jgi:hypothetical protein